MRALFLAWALTLFLFSSALSAQAYCPPELLQPQAAPSRHDPRELTLALRRFQSEDYQKALLSRAGVKEIPANADSGQFLHAAYDAMIARARTQRSTPLNEGKIAHAHETIDAIMGLKEFRLLPMSQKDIRESGDDWFLVFAYSQGFYPVGVTFRRTKGDAPEPIDSEEFFRHDVGHAFIAIARELGLDTELDQFRELRQLPDIRSARTRRLAWLTDLFDEFYPQRVWRKVVRVHFRLNHEAGQVVGSEHFRSCIETGCVPSELNGVLPALQSFWAARPLSP